MYVLAAVRMFLLLSVAHRLCISNTQEVLEVEAVKALDLVSGIYAVPEPGSVLHQMLYPDEPVHIRIGGRLVTVPRPRLPIATVRQDGVDRPMVVMGPPWSLFNRYLLAASDSDRAQVRSELEAWLTVAARRKLLQADSMMFPGIMSYVIGTPLVPRGEVWIGMRGLDVHPSSEGFAIRWPIASANPLRCVIRIVHDRFGVFMNDEDLVIDRQGDSDGDLVFVVWTGGSPAEAREIRFTADEIADLSIVVDVPNEVEQLDPQSLANGHAARSLVGLATWWAWVDARWGYDHRGEDAWREAYDRYTPAIEAMMDGRKTGQKCDLSEFGFGQGVPELGVLIRMALPGVRHMVAARSRPPDFRTPWRQLVREYWSLRWAPEGVELGE